MSKLKIALISHDNKKPDMVSFVMKRRGFFANNTEIFATRSTGMHVQKAGLTNVTVLNSGPIGGDAEIAAMIVNKQIDVVIFFIDPLDVHPHQSDVNMLLRICNVHNVPLATNEAGASVMLSYYENIKNSKVSEFA